MGKLNVYGGSRTLSSLEVLSRGSRSSFSFLWSLVRIAAPRQNSLWHLL